MYICKSMRSLSQMLKSCVFRVVYLVFDVCLVSIWFGFLALFANCIGWKCDLVNVSI